jgi:hypothetical protein
MRLDRGMYTGPIWCGLVLSGVYVLATPQIITSIPDWAENALAAELGLAALICLTGQRLDDRWLAYQYERIGLAGIVLVLGILAVATDVPVVAQFTLSGGLGALVQIGSIRMFYRLTIALRGMDNSYASSSDSGSASDTRERQLDARSDGGASGQ